MYKDAGNGRMGLHAQTARAQTDGSYNSVVSINDCLKEEELVSQGLMSLLAEVNRLSKRPHDQGHNLEGDPR